MAKNPFAAIVHFREDNHSWDNWLKPNRRAHLGAEYNEIAVALRNGRGFADPFREKSGPTAWMPPVLPLLLAAIYGLTNDNPKLVTEIYVAFQAGAVAFTSWIVLMEARKLRLAAIGIVVVVVGLTANFRELFQKTHDTGLLLITVNVLWLSAVRWWHCPASKGAAAVWGFFGGFAALCSPVIGATWALLVACRWLIWPSRLAKILHCRQVAIAAVVSICLITPWTVRNRLVLGKWIPIKSNGMYELYQSQYLDDDGVLDSNVNSFHPWAYNGSERQLYRELGEIEFIEQRGTLARELIQADPLEFCSRIFNRFSAACIYYQPFDILEETRLLWPTRFKRLVFWLPLASVLVILAFHPNPLRPEIAAAIAIYALVLLPYVLVSYYDRYAAPLVGMKMIIVLYAVHSLRGYWSRNRDSPHESR